MPKISITTNDGILIEQIELSEWDLDKPFAKHILLGEIIESVRIAEEQEREESNDG